MNCRLRKWSAMNKGIPFTSSANVCGRRLGFYTMKRDLCSAQFVVDYDKFGDRGQKANLRLYN